MKFIKIRNNKIEAAEQPTTPKPTTTLPNNMTWAWDPKANQWIAVMKDNPVVTPPTYNPNNVNNLNNTTTTTQMYTPIKSSYFDINLLIKALKKHKEIFGDSNEYSPQIIIFITNPEQTEIIDTKLINKETASSYPIKDNEFFLFMDRDTGWELTDYNLHPTSELKRYYGSDEEQKEWYKEFTKQSTLIDSLNQFLDGDKYSKEIKIEKGLISGGLIKLAGINPIRGPKYSITDKGLQLLKQAAQEEYNIEKKSYLIDWYTRDISTLDTTAKTIKSEESTNELLEKSWNKYYPLFMEDLNNYTITEENYFDEDPIAVQLKSILKALFNSENDKNSNIDTYLYTTQLFKDMIIENTKKGQSVLLEGQMPKFSIFEKDGSELAQIQANNETDAKVKFIMENPEYEGSQTISVKKVNASNEQDLNTQIKKELEQIALDAKEYIPYNQYLIKQVFVEKGYFNKYLNTIEGELSYIIYYEYTPINNTKLHYSEIKKFTRKISNWFNKYFKKYFSYNDTSYNILDPHYQNMYCVIRFDVKLKVNKDNFKIEQNIDAKEIDSTYSETTIQGLDFPNQSVSPSIDVKVDPKGWVNMAGLKIEAVKLTPKLLQLGNILMPYINNNSIGVSIADENKGMISARGDAKTINIIESKIRDLGIFCNNETLPADEGKGIYTLNIFLED